MEQNHWYVKEPVKGMLHWQSPPWVDDRSRFDAQRIIRLYADAGIRTITPHIKHIDGYCFYPSAFRELKPEKDFIGELVHEAKKAGMRVIPYYMVVADKWAGSEHPEWACRNSDGRTKEGFGSIFCCINHPGYREFTLGQIAEIMDRYEVDGLWSDELNWGDEGCYCPSCRALFGKKYGMDLLKAKGRQMARDFFNACWEDFTRKMHEIIAGGDKKRIFIYNGGGLHSYCKDFGRYAAVNSCEAHSALFASERCRYLRGLDKPYEICYATEKDWGGLMLNTEEEVRLIAAEITAHGGMAMLGTNFTPRGEVLEAGIRFAGSANRYVQGLREYLTDTRPLYDAGILWPGAEEPKMGMALMQFDIPYGYVSMDQDWSGLQTVYSQTFLKPLAAPDHVKDDVNDIFPDGGVPGDLNGPAADKVRKYVAGGGVFIMELPHAGVLEDPGIDFILKDVMGISYAGKSNYDGHYVRVLEKDMQEGLPGGFPLLVPGEGCRIKAGGAEILAETVYPIRPLDDFYKLQKYITNGPDDRIPATPAITANRYGKGYGVCVSLPLSRAATALKYGKGHPFHFWPRKLLSNLLRHLTGEPLLLPYSPLGVEVVVNRQESAGRYVIHLFNHYGLRGVPFIRESFYEPNPETVYLSDVPLVLNKNRLGEIKRIYAAVGKGDLAVQERGKWLYITIPRMGQHEVVILEDR